MKEDKDLYKTNDQSRSWYEDDGIYYETKGDKMDKVLDESEYSDDSGSEESDLRKEEYKKRNWFKEKVKRNLDRHYDRMSSSDISESEDYLDDDENDQEKEALLEIIKKRILHLYGSNIHKMEV